MSETASGNPALIILALAVAMLGIESATRSHYAVMKPEVHTHTRQVMVQNDDAWTIIEWKRPDGVQCGTARRWNSKFTADPDQPRGVWDVYFFDEGSTDHYFTSPDAALDLVRKWCKP